MPVTTEDVQEAVKVLWDQAADLTAIVPGGLILGRVADPAANPVASPYTTFAVEDGAVEVAGASAYVQRFVLTFTTYDESGAVDLGLVKVQLEAAFFIKTRTSVALSSGRTLVILHSIKAPGGLKEDDATQQARSVKVATDKYDVLCQG